jgi:alpha-beta hydrolase superfamily lysophospholipase
MPERITFKTTDDVEIVGDWVTAPTTIGAVILLHSYSTARQSWAAFQRTLAQRGLASLAIDLRGHGESLRGEQGVALDYKKFAEEDHLASMEDVRGAYEWIRKRGIERARIAVVGASIGANMALRFLSEEPQVAAAGLLSPGVNFHGVETPDAAEHVIPEQGVWMAASAGDDQESYNSVLALDPLLEIQHKTIERLQGAGHGLKMFDADAALMGKLADWLRDRVLGVE